MKKYDVTITLVDGSIHLITVDLSTENNKNNKNIILDEWKKNGIWLTPTKYIFPGSIIMIEATLKI